jgi:hypothetical protein
MHLYHRSFSAGTTKKFARRPTRQENDVKESNGGYKSPPPLSKRVAEGHPTWWFLGWLDVVVKRRDWLVNQWRRLWYESDLDLTKRVCQSASSSLVVSSTVVHRTPPATMAPSSSSSSSFRERLAWLSRMPTHWRVLLLSQTVFTLFAFSYRQVVVSRRRHQLLQENQDEAGAGPAPSRRYEWKQSNGDWYFYS